MLLAFVLSASAMFYLAYVQVYPTDTANYLMNTEHHDHGEFWLLKETPLAHVVVGTIALALFGFGYIALVAFMLCFRHRALTHAHPPRPKPATATVQPRSQSFRLAIQPLLRRFSARKSGNAGSHSHHSSQDGVK
ncbi:hypothetical protein Poli38472_011386 [Pythium oligandrum]|uniref:Uncharacterized protein n=1 Tax=Pythium oligandrum TaxID=41045 RepID=A0A8K1CJ14_PYTOL|nr:hypothetical protein Poli38472_011386 [Pythium oligandrum]|eukprot:TMW64506.1 hypothetical protein Poli38472_011386 [Pythium oligandrum]